MAFQQHISNVVHRPHSIRLSQANESHPLGASMHPRKARQYAWNPGFCQAHVRTSLLINAPGHFSIHPSVVYDKATIGMPWILCHFQPNRADSQQSSISKTPTMVPKVVFLLADYGHDPTGI
jgi:hypothetical protein